MREMGGLLKPMPITAATWIIGSLSLAGVLPLAGFFSKDEVVHSVWSANSIAGIALLVASFLTAFYITRATRLTFFGEFRGEGHPHEGGWVMTVPLLVLAAFTIALGWTGHAIAELLHGHAESLDLVTAAVSTVVAFTGIGLGWFAYRHGVASETDMENRLGGLWSTLRNAYGFDGFVMRVIVNPTVWVCSWTYRFIDRRVIDGLVEGVGTASRYLGYIGSMLQNGEAQWYAALIGAGAVGLAALVLTLGG
jgi:NADH-quinone oxidoreductase subunit L